MSQETLKWLVLYLLGETSPDGSEEKTKCSNSNSQDREHNFSGVTKHVLNQGRK